jgi:hypothetical protein
MYLEAFVFEQADKKDSGNHNLANNDERILQRSDKHFTACVGCTLPVINGNE